MDARWFTYTILILMIGLVVLFLLSRLKYLWMQPHYTYSQSMYTFPFKTGDLVLTCDKIPVGTLCAPAGGVKLFTGSSYNHTGMIYVEPVTRQVFVWEMNGRGTRLASLYDMTCGKTIQDISIRPLNKPIDCFLFEEMMRKQWEYEFNFDIGLSWYNRYLPIVPFLKGHQWGKGKRQRTCAHMTTEMYDALGVIDLSGSGVDPSSVFAVDFSKEKIDTKILPMTNGYEFGPIVKLKFKISDKNDFHIRHQ